MQGFYIMIGIYKITNPIGQIYIGSSVNINARISFHKTAMVRNNPKTLISKSYIKYGFENHKVEIIENCVKENLTIRERYWQDFYNCFSENGLNINKSNNTIFINGKRKRKVLSKNRINGHPIILNTENGIYYIGLKEVIFVYNIYKEITIRQKLYGYRKNNTPFVICNL